MLCVVKDCHLNGTYNAKVCYYHRYLKCPNKCVHCIMEGVTDAKVCFWHNSNNKCYDKNCFTKSDNKPVRVCNYHKYFR